MGDMMTEMLTSHQSMRNHLQSNNEVVQGMQNAQKEHKANMDMLHKQLSQLASSMNEISENAGRLPATVHIPYKANVSKITLRSGTSYKEPKWKESLEESSKMKDNGDTLTKRSGTDETEPLAKPQIYEAPKESSRDEEKIVIEGSTSAMVQKNLPPKRSDPGWCDLTSIQTLTDQDIEEAIKEFYQKSKFAGATVAHQLAEKKAERKQGLKRALRRIIGRMIEKKKTPSKVSTPVQISREEDKTPHNKKKSKATNGPHTKLGADPKHVITKSRTPVVAGHPSQTPTGQEEGSPTKPRENLTATFT